MHNLNRHLAEQFEVHVVCPHAPGAMEEEVLDGIQVHRFRYAPGNCETLVQDGGILNNLKHRRWKWLLVPFFLAALAIKTWWLIRQLRPACIHAHWIIPQGLALTTALAFMRSPPPFMLTSHGGDLYGLRGRVFRALKSAVARRADLVTVVSSPMAEEVRRLGVRPERVHVISMGADFGGSAVPIAEASRQTGEMLFVGRLVEKKGLRFLIEALPAIVARMPEAHLYIAGFGPEESSLRGQVDQLALQEHVTFLGGVAHAELPALYRRASICIAPFVEASTGDQEGLPLVVLEAIANGCPIVVGDLAVLDDILTPGEADFRVDPRLPEMLADRVLSVMENGEAAVARTRVIRERLIVRHGWEYIAAEHSLLLQGLIR